MSESYYRKIGQCSLCITVISDLFVVPPFPQLIAPFNNFNMLFTIKAVIQRFSTARPYGWGTHKRQI